MTKYVALLKGINVGKAKRLAMADLRSMLSGLGYDDVVTHLQSGNAVFKATGPAGEISAAVEKALLETQQLDVRVVVRTHAQLVKAVKADPYADIADDPAKHVLGFFSAVPTRERLAAFHDLVVSKKMDPQIGGLHEIAGDHCYLWCPQGVLKSLFGTVDWDRKLGVTVTMRNFSTVARLLEMSA